MQVNLNNKTILDFVSRWDPSRQQEVINDLLLISINTVLHRLKNQCVSDDDAGMLIQKMKKQQANVQPQLLHQQQIQQQLAQLKEEIHKINTRLRNLNVDSDNCRVNKNNAKSNVTPKVTEVHPIINRYEQFRLTKHHLDDRQLKQALTYDDVDTRKNKSVAGCRPSQENKLKKIATENITTCIPSEYTVQKHKSNEKQTPKHLRKIQSRIKELVSKDRQETSGSKIFKKIKTQHSGNPETAKRQHEQLSFKNIRTEGNRRKKARINELEQNHEEHLESHSVSDFSAFQMSHDAADINSSHDSRRQYKQVGKISRRSRQSNIKIGEDS